MSKHIEALKEIHRWIPEGAENHPRMRDAIDALESERTEMLDALNAILIADQDSFQDAGTPDNPRTEHVCITCGPGCEGDDCPIEDARTLVAKIEVSK